LVAWIVFGPRLLLFLLRLSTERLIAQTVLPALPESLRILQAIFCRFDTTSARGCCTLQSGLIPVRRICA
jgi:hypothetical protein